MTTACEYCGVLDALDRHDGTCPRARELGLPRLAEGEAPIDPTEIDDSEDEAAEQAEAAEAAQAVEESGYDGPIANESEISPNHLAHPRWHTADRPTAPPPTGQWISYRAELGGHEFDAVIFATELDALRHAVGEEGYKVHPLELGRSLRDQVEPA
jgi:hypothetical protein